jgi:asparagine synthetase B (glutamine-hydrolysing)
VRGLQTYTFGIPNCDDISIARQTAHAVGAPHQEFSLPSDYLEEYAGLGVRLTDGMDSCIHIHTLANLDAQAREVDVLYTGYYIDSITDSDGTREWLVRFDDDTSLQLLYAYMHRIFPHDPPEAVFTPEFLAATGDEFASSFRQTAIEVKGDSMSSWLESVEIVHRQRRLTQFGNDLVRWQLECRTPFTDADVVDFCLALPPGLRMDRILFTEILVEHFPRLAKIVNDRTGMPFLVDARYLSLQARHNLRYLLYQRGLSRKPMHQRKLYARYDQWFRTDLRDWVERTLLHPIALDRGIVQEAALRRVLDEHMSGAADRTREIGMLLSVELWHQAYMD